MISVMFGVLLVQALASGTQFSAPGILLLWAVLVAGVWGLAFLVAHQLISQADDHSRARVWLAAGLCAALCAALIHNLVGFSLGSKYSGLEAFSWAGVAEKASIAIIKPSEQWHTGRIPLVL